MQVVVDPQASGWRDDGSESGRLRVESVRGNLVAVPFREDNFVDATAVGTSAAMTFRDDAYMNDDGTQTGIEAFITHNANYGNYGKIRVAFSGTVFGLRWARKDVFSANFGDTPIGCFIDRVAYEVSTPRNIKFDDQTDDAIDSGFYGSIIATDLPAGAHKAEIVIPCSTTVDRWALITGMLLEESAGYRPMPRGVRLDSGAYALTGSFQTIYPVNGISGRNFANWTRTTKLFVGATYAIRKIFFSNPTAAPITLQLRQNSNNGVFLIKSVAAGDTYEFDPGAPMYQTIDALGNGLIANVSGVM